MATPSKNIMWLTISRVISLVLLFLAYTQLFRYLGVEKTGQFQFVLSYVTLFGVVIDFGIQQYVTKRISEDHDKAKTYFHAFLAVEIILAALVYGAMIAVAYINNYDPIVKHAILIAGFGVCLHGLIYPFLAVISSYYDLKKVALLNLISSVINVSIIFLTIWAQGSILMLVSQQIIYAALAIILYYRFVQPHIGKPQVISGILRTEFSLVKEILRSALPFAMLVGFSTLYNRIDIILITKILGYTQTGLYSVAYKFFDLIAFFPAVVSHTLYPLFANLMAKRDLADVKTILEKYLRLMSALALPMATGAMLLAHQIVPILGGQGFEGSVRVLQVLAWAPAILFVYIVVNALMISQLTKFATIVTGVNVVVNIAGNLYLLPRYGIVAAAVMTVFSELIQGVFYFYFVRKKITNFAFFRNLWQPLIASIVMGVVVFYTRDLFIIIPVLVGGAVYSITLLGLGFFKKEDYHFLMGLLRRGYEPTK